MIVDDLFGIIHVVSLSVFPFGSRSWFIVLSVVVYILVECFLVWKGGLIE